MNNTIDRKRWLTLIVLCMGVLMIVLDTTIVNVALPSIRADLGFSATKLVWVVNGYILTFAGFLLLGGRLGDLFGRRRLFTIGISVFTLASLTCGLAHSQIMLIIARAIQGLGGAVVSAVSLSLIMQLFTQPSERAKAMGIFGFVSAGGGSIGVLLGGFLTGSLNWHWVFLVNIPIGILVFIFCRILLPKDQVDAEKLHVDYWGAITITLAQILAVYAIVGSNEAGWLSLKTLGILGLAVILFISFIQIEKRVAHPLVPLTLFQKRNVIVSNIIGVLWSAGMFAWFFISALYLQIILGFNPLQVGLSFLPANLLMALFSLGLSARIVMKYGLKRPLGIGMLFVTAGLLLFSLAPEQGRFITNVLPAMILFGFGAGLAFNPMLLSAMSDVSEDESGLASGVVNTSFMMGGAIGLAVLVSIATSRTEHLLTVTTSQNTALISGYHYAFSTGAFFVIVAAILAFAALRSRPVSNAAQHLA